MELPQNLNALFFWVFCAMISLLLSVFAFIAHAIREDFREMSKSLRGVTLNLAILSTKLESIDARLEKLERIDEN